MGVSFPYSPQSLSLSPRELSGCLGALSGLQAEDAGRVRAGGEGTILSCYTTISY